MNGLNAFIVEILTIDYSYFWESMEVIVSADGTLIPVCDDSLTVDLKEGKFIPFANTDISVHYNKKNLLDDYQSCPSVSLIQSAITDLLNLTKEQQRAQVDRLSRLEYFWRYDFLIGMCKKSIIYQCLYISNYGYRKMALLLLQDMASQRRVISKNIPLDINKICFNATFFTPFECYIYLKVQAIQFLIEATGIENDFWSRLKIQVDDLPTVDIKEALKRNSFTSSADSGNSNSQKAEITVPVVAMVCVYLEKAGLFKVGPLKRHFEKYILPKYPYSYKSLSNDYYHFGPATFDWTLG